MKWTQCELGDVVNFKSGGTPSKSDPELWGGDIPWVSTKELKSGRIHTTESRVTDKAIKNKKQLVDPGTVLIAVRGMVLAKAFPVSVAMRSMIFNQDIKAVIPKDGLLHDYLPYLLRGHHDELRALADEAAHGTKRIQTDRLLSFPIKLPPVPVQGCITAILSAYDDLIENNTRRIEILEEMARRLYEEWFVHFRFPGYEEVRFKESELGEIPEGWKPVAFSEVASFMNGFAFKPSHFTDDGLPIIKIKELKSGVTADTPRCSGEVKEKYLVKDGDVLFSWSAHLDAYIWRGGEGWLNQHLFKVDGIDGIPKSFLYFSLKEKMVDFRAKSMGTTMQHIKRSALNEVKFPMPLESLISQFDDLVTPILNQILVLQRKNANLRAQRDLLLPKLVSGEIDVSGIPMPDDKEVEAA